MVKQTFDVMGFIESLVLPDDELKFISIERVATTEVESYEVHYLVTCTDGEKREMPIGVQWASKERVLRFAMNVDLTLVDASDDREMERLRDVINQINAIEWLVGKVVLFAEDGEVDVCIAFPMNIPFDHFRSMERRTFLRILAGHNLCSMFGEVVKVVRGIEDLLRPDAVKAEEQPHMLQ